MKVLVYPHDLNMGGSQLNAIELARGVKDLGHECVVYGRPGALCNRITELGLEFIESPDPGRRPSVGIARDLRRLVGVRGFDILHGYEWPPGIEGAIAAVGLPGVVSVCTVMSMAVAPFIPRWVPLIVGTRQIAAHERSVGREVVHLLEPPVDLARNQPPSAMEQAAFAARWGLDGRPLVVCVGRLANELKSEGVLTAVRVAGELASRHPFQLLIVGDGSARPLVAEAAASVNRDLASETVILTGELADPRAAYAAADVVLGMGGSALRALAFAKPLVVQGERGFFETLTPDSVELFRWQGWYGIGNGPSEGARRLSSELLPLLESPSRRSELGAFGSRVVQEFALDTAARRQVEIYSEALADPVDRAGTWRENARSASSFTTYYIGKRWARLRRAGRTDDFNANPVAANDVSTRPSGKERSGVRPGPLVYFPGVDWDAVVGTDRQLATALAESHRIIWVDPPQSVWSAYRRKVRTAPVSDVGPNLTRLHTFVLPGVTRPGLRSLAELMTVWHLRAHLRSESLTPAAVISSGSQPFLARYRPPGCGRIFFATDDAVAGARLWNMSPRRIRTDREANLRAADLVLAVTSELAEELRRDGTPTLVFPNGCDIDRYRSIDDVRRATDVHLPDPVVGVVGQFNERTDLEALRAVAAGGLSLLLVGPTYFASTSAATEFTRIRAMPGVQWVGRVPAEDLPGYMRALAVGLTAYADNVFNRRSFPLKTLDYLAAGVPVVASSVAPIDGLDTRYVRVASSPTEFVTQARALATAGYARAEIRASVAGFSWRARASELIALIEDVPR